MASLVADRHFVCACARVIKILQRSGMQAGCTFLIFNFFLESPPRVNWELYILERLTVPPTLFTLWWFIHSRRKQAENSSLVLVKKNVLKANGSI